MQAEQLTSAHRGAPENPANRFEKIHLEPDAVWNPEEDVLPRTQFLKDHSQTAIAYNDSPDIGFSERQSLSWLRTRLHLLLRAPDARVSGIFRRTRF
jgi:hypothetical protein